MFVDASAMVAMVVPEADGELITAKLETAERLFVSPIAVWESTVALARIRQCSVDVARLTVQRFVDAVEAESVDIDATVGALAIQAFARFGKGRHPAALNMGDCFAYACAQKLGVSLLCKGDDFPQTDAALA